MLAAVGVGKSYAGVPVLSDVSFELHPREVIAVAGENGAGKSTLLNVLTGVVRPDLGRVLVRGEPVELHNNRDANEHGIFRVFQELSLVPNVPVYENLFLAHEEHFRRFGVLRRGAMVRRAREFLEEFEHGWIDPERETGSYDFSVRQVIEIIKVFVLSALLEAPTPALLLDEPTAGLLQDETEFFFRLLAKARERAGIVFVGHRLSELLAHSDRIIVLKDGVMVASRPTAEINEGDLHALMVGRARGERFYKEDRQRVALPAPVLEVRNLSAPPLFRDVSFEVHEGEIVGIGGVLGSGKSPLARALFGVEGKASGEVLVHGKPLARGSIQAAMEAGMGYVPPDRADEGVMLPISVCWNLSIAKTAIGRGVAGNVIALRREKHDARHLVDVLRVRASGIDAQLQSLSGGNQQKVVLGRWLALGVDVLVLDNPTRGVDAGAKEDIYGVMRDLADRGTAILLISDDLPELIGMSNRVIAMKAGEVVTLVDASPERKPTEVELVAQMV